MIVKKPKTVVEFVVDYGWFLLIILLGLAIYCIVNTTAEHDSYCVTQGFAAGYAGRFATWDSQTYILCYKYAVPYTSDPSGEVYLWVEYNETKK